MGKYDALGDFLRASGRKEFPLSFAELERILGFSLPSSAHMHRPWWAADRSHVQAAAWLDAGYQAARPNLAQQTVVFVKAPRP